MTQKIGKAYAFFNCDASKKGIEGTLPKIRKAVGTPSELELSLTEGMDPIRGDKKLMDLTREAKEFGMDYMLKAEYPGGTNIQTADELASMLNQAYQSPLYQANEPFSGQIVYKENGDYVFRE